MQKTYLRYKQRSSFGIVTSPLCNIDASPNGEVALSGGLEDAHVWDVKTGTLLRRLVSEDDHTGLDLPAQVTAVAMGSDGISAAVGYSDGVVRVFDIRNGERLCTFKGHRKSVTCVGFDESCGYLGSGSKDTTAIVWDIAAQSGICRLMGHRDEVTACRLVPKAAPAGALGDLAGHEAGAARKRARSEGGRISELRLLTSSKDASVKLWDLETQSCAQTLQSHRNEVWDFAVVGALGGVARARSLRGPAGTAAGDGPATNGSAAGSKPRKAASRKRGREQESEGSGSSADVPPADTDQIAEVAAQAGLDKQCAPYRIITGGADGQLRMFALRTAEAAS